MNQAGPLEPILQEIDKAIEAELYYLALSTALTLPDVCSALEQPSGRTNGNRYKDWYRKHVQSHFPWLSPADCYSIRSGVSHQGSFGRGNVSYSRVVFTLPDKRVTMTNCVINDVYVTSLTGFCETMIAIARNWYANERENQHVKSNIANLVRPGMMDFRPAMGIDLPVIA